jgi:hypothetical protein
MKPIYIFLIVVLVVLFISELFSSVFACSGCMYASMDMMLPPITIWCLFGILWFIALSFITAINGNKVTGIPSVSKSIVIVLVIYFISSLVGPVSIFLIIPPMIIAFRVLLLKRGSIFNQTSIKGLRVASILGLTSITCLAAYSVIVHATRTDIDFAIQWRNTYAGRGALVRFASSGPDATAKLRRLLKSPDTGIAALAARGLTYSGDPEIDVPYLQDSLEYQRTRNGDSQYLREIEESISIMKSKIEPSTKE